MAKLHPSVSLISKRHYPSGTFLSALAILLLVFFFGSAHIVQAFNITFGWNPNQEADLAGYKLYFGNQSGGYTSTVDVGNATQYTLNGLDDTKMYYFALTAYNTGNAESAFSSEIYYSTTGGSGYTVAQADPGTADSSGATGGGDSGGGGGGGGCFIATAIYGPQAPEVLRLKQFRDRHLLTNMPGKAFVTLYYRYSPPIARVMRKSPLLCEVGRSVISPIVYALDHTALMLFSMVCVGAFFGLATRLRRGRG